MDIGRALKEFREEKGLNQKELALLTGLEINQSHISKIENGQRTPTKSTMDKILEPFNMVYVDFLKEYCGEGQSEYVDDSLNIGQGLKNLRRSLGLTQIEFASKVVISRSYLGNIEVNRGDPSMSTLSRILKPCGVSLVVFMVDYCHIMDEYNKTVR